MFEKRWYAEMMSQSDTIKFLCKNGVDVTHYSYNYKNNLFAIADKVAEKEYKRVLLDLCQVPLKGGVQE